MKKYGVVYTREQNNEYVTNYRMKEEKRKKYLEYMKKYHLRRKIAEQIEKGEIMGLATILPFISI